MLLSVRRNGLSLFHGTLFCESVAIWDLFLCYCSHIVYWLILIGLGERGYILFGEKIDVKICIVLIFSIFFLVKLRKQGFLNRKQEVYCFSKYFSVSVIPVLGEGRMV